MFEVPNSMLTHHHGHVSFKLDRFDADDLADAIIRHVNDIDADHPLPTEGEKEWQQ